MRSLLNRIFFYSLLGIFTICLSSAVSYASESAHGGGDSGGHGGGHGGGEAKEEKPKKMKGSFSEEDMEQMRLYQHIQNISSPRYQVSEYATFFFEQRGEKYVPILLKHLKRHDDNDKVISAVIYTFGRMGKNAARAVPIITQYLNYKNIEIKRTAISSLGKIGRASDSAVPEIAKFLEDEDEWTRTLALRSLKNINTPQAKGIAAVYEKKLQLEQERKNRALLDEGTDKPAEPLPVETQSVPAVNDNKVVTPEQKENN